MATARPTASVYGADGSVTGSVSLPAVFSAPLRADIVRQVHIGMNKNRRQAQGVKYEAGYDTAAASWGTGRAVSRIPRAPGGGTHRASQGAFGNMCRGGGMFNPTKIWRRWHRRVNVTQKRHAVAISVAASAVPALVMARGHAISEVPELPLVIAVAAESTQKTKEAVALLKKLGAEAELQKVIDSKRVRAGRGKCRNRRYVMKKGPLVVFAGDEGIEKAFRNIPGVDLCSVERLNLLQLAPGGQFGRFVVYTEGAVARLGGLFGDYSANSSEKKGYTLPRPIMKNADVARIINSNEVQSVLTPAKTTPLLKTCRQRKNPLKNQAVLGRLCPWAAAVKRAAKKHQSKPVKKSAEQKKALKTQKKKFFKQLKGAYDAKEEAATEE